MTISQIDKREADLMSLMIFHQFNQQVKIVKKLDQKMEDTIENLLFDRYIFLCQQKASRMVIKRLSNYKNSIGEDWKEAFNFTSFLHKMQDKIMTAYQNQRGSLFKKKTVVRYTLIFKC